MKNSIVENYKTYRKKRIFFIGGMLLSLFFVAQLSLLLGSMDIGITELLNWWQGKASHLSYQVITEIRMPRMVGAILAGMALAVSGAVIQSLLRNPLASPFTLGISSASAFGAAFAIIVLGAGSHYASADDASLVNNPFILAGSAFTWSLASVAIIFTLSKYRGATPEIIILSGIIISSLFGAAISAMQYFADNIQLAAIVFWTFGDLARASWTELLLQALIIIPAMVFLFRQSWNYKALQSGDEYAKTLGIHPQKVRLTGLVLASLITAIVVAFYGVIAFVGLVVPHIIRRIIGGDELFLLPASALFGSLFLLLSDTLARTIISPVVLPVGILTSFIGAPLFLFLLIRGIGKGYWK